MSDSGKKLPTESELREKYENGLKSGNIHYDETKGRNENYEEWKYNAMRKSASDYDYH